MNTAKAYEYRHVVCFEDTNLVGNVYYASYVAWQGRVREMFLKEKAPQIIEDLKGGLVLATLSVSCEYFHELVAFDEVRIELRLGAMAGSRMTLLFEYWKTAAAEPLLVAKGQQRIGCLRRQGAGVVAEPIPSYFEQALGDYRSHTNGNL
jgi:enediyne biosynthesis thioesterase